MEDIINSQVTLPGTLVNATSISNVLEGTVSDDTCKSNPCFNDGVCIIDFNDYV